MKSKKTKSTVLGALPSRGKEPFAAKYFGIGNLGIGVWIVSSPVEPQSSWVT